MPFSCTFSYSMSVVCLQVNKGVQAQAIFFFFKPDSQHNLERKAENSDQRMREFQGKVMLLLDLRVENTGVQVVKHSWSYTFVVGKHSSEYIFQ